MSQRGNYLAVQWLELYTLTAEGPGSVLDQGIKIPQAAQCGINKNPLMSLHILSLAIILICFGVTDVIDSNQYTHFTSHNNTMWALGKDINKTLMFL